MENIHGFKLLSSKKIDDINATLHEFEHLKTGAKVAYLENDDTNCCFAIGFRTVPEDDSGFAADPAWCRRSPDTSCPTRRGLRSSPPPRAAAISAGSR